MRFFHQGQASGLTKRIPIHLCRGPAEQPKPDVRLFYDRLLACLRHPSVHEGTWQLLECKSAWDGNWTWDCFICFAWRSEGMLLIAIVNYAPNQSQCYVQMPFEELKGKAIRLVDLMSGMICTRGDEILWRGLYFDFTPWGYHVFEVTTSEN
jgi:hypothetical protein